MRWPLVLAFGLAVPLWGWSADVAWAQYRAPYRSASPTLSPWLNLYRSDKGPLDPYHSFVQPEMEFRQTVEQQERINDRYQADIRGLADSVTRFQDAGTNQPTGTGGGFMYLSHYYDRGYSAQGGSANRAKHLQLPPSPSSPSRPF